MSLDELSQRNRHLFLHGAWEVHVTRDVEQLRPRVPLPPKAGKPSSATATDRRRHSNGLHVGHCSWASKYALM